MRLRNSFFLFFLLGNLLLLSLTGDALARQQWSHTRPEINLTHIFTGEINARGKPVGFHSRPGGRDPAHARLKKILGPPDSSGVYTALVEIYDPREHRWKQKFSTFFPDSMSRKEVIKAILHAWRHRETNRSQPWRGPSGKGFQIQGYTNRRGNINTAFPVYNSHGTSVTQRRTRMADQKRAARRPSAYKKTDKE